jgi:Recombinase
LRAFACQIALNPTPPVAWNISPRLTADRPKAAASREVADAFAANVLPIVRQIQAVGVTTFRAIAAALNDRGVRTARGGAWHDSTVRNLLARAA